MYLYHKASKRACFKHKMALQVARSSFSVLRHSMRKFSQLQTRPVALGVHSVLKCVTCRTFHGSSRRQDLMEFFDTKENFSKKEIRTGRPWKIEELRIKSNTDLHKLWYVLLKERNMLLSMRHEYRRQHEYFPNPERLEKVDESMENLMDVIKERNNAYHELETGTSAEPKRVEAVNYLGMTYMRKPTEHAVPSYRNKGFMLVQRHREPWMTDYHRRIRERAMKVKSREQKRQDRYVKRVKKDFPSVSEEDLEHGIKQERKRYKHGFYDVE